VLELAGPTGLGAMTVRVAYRATTAQTGRIYDYAWFMFFILLYFFAGAEVACLATYVRLRPRTVKLLFATAAAVLSFFILQPVLTVAHYCHLCALLLADVAIFAVPVTYFVLLTPTRVSSATHTLNR